MSAQTLPFRPRRWLRNPHVQSILASSGVRRMLLRQRHSAIEEAAQERLQIPNNQKQAKKMQQIGGLSGITWKQDGR